MWLLSASILLFIVVIGLIVYANWPASGTSCGGGCGGGCSSCQQKPCDRCQKPKSRCGCQQPQGGCPFC
uniref:Uncharacterized protein n=1 Tax=viral metagenome TaxID=1070528 RepID=A0A6C0DU00_9ZZZZ